MLAINGCVIFVSVYMSETREGKITIKWKIIM